MTDEEREKLIALDWPKDAAKISCRVEWLLGWGRGFDAQSSEIKKLTQELAAIDEGFARGPALADCKTRYEKAVKACHTAARTEVAEAEIEKLKAALQQILEWERDYRTRNMLGSEAPHPFIQAEELLR